ncbi:MAG: glycosyltransferase family 2 protein [Ferruginibacter sp.]|nr:glycosyltransferase family 2 protein [Ferruginibacter sp.]
MPKVSIIIPCYNQGAFLEEAIDSVLAQTYRDFEIIVVNDGSGDEHTLAVLNALQKPNTVILHTVNRGVSAARNYGIAHSSGEFILPLDADDRIDTRFLSLAVPLLDQDQQLEIIGTGVEYFGSVNGTEILPVYHPAQHLLRNLFFNTSLFRKTGFEKINGYDEAFREGWEDWDMFLRLIDRPEQTFVIQDFLLHYRIKKSSRNADLFLEKKHRVEQQFYCKHIKKYMEHFPEPIQVLRDNAYLKEQVENFERYKAELSNSLSYRLGNFILGPLKWIKSIDRKK